MQDGLLIRTVLIKEENIVDNKYNATGIAKKLVSVMNECSFVPKNGMNTFHNYKYATAEDILTAVNKSLAKHGIACIVIPTLESNIDVLNKSGNIEHLATVSVHIQLIDSDSGESVDLFGMGSGQDAADKAVMKAQTAAIKYAFMLSLCIATGDDPEADLGTDERNCGEPQYQSALKQTVHNTNAVQFKENSKNQDNGAICVACGKEITPKVLQYSLARYKRPLCMECQKKEHSAA